MAILVVSRRPRPRPASTWPPRPQQTIILPSRSHSQAKTLQASTFPNPCPVDTHGHLARHLGGLPVNLLQSHHLHDHVDSTLRTKLSSLINNIWFFLIHSLGQRLGGMYFLAAYLLAYVH